MRALNWVAIFACLWVLFMLAGCTKPDPVDPTETTDTGTIPSVDPDLAVTSVSGVQEGPDVLLTFHTATPVTRTLQADVTWLSESYVVSLDVPIEEGVAVVPMQVIACRVFNATQALVVWADGRRFDLSVPLVGVVEDEVLSPSIEGELWATCAAEEVFLEGSGAAYQFRSTPGLLTGGGDSGEGAVTVEGDMLLWLEADRVYTWEWRADPPHILMVRWGE